MNDHHQTTDLIEETTAMPNEIVPLRKLIADTAEWCDGRMLDADDPYCPPMIAKLDDVAAEQIAVKVAAYFGHEVTV